MKNRSITRNLLAVAGLTGLFLTASMSGVTAQDKKSDEATREVRLKIITNINGKETIRDTVVQITGDLPIPDLKELEKFRTRFSGPAGKEMEELLSKRLPNDEMFRRLEKAEELRTKMSEIRMPEGMEKQVFRTENLKDGNVKIYRLAKPGGEFTVDSIREIKVLRLNDMPDKVEFNSMPFKEGEFRQVDIQKIRELLPISGDSIVTFNRIIIVNCDQAAKTELKPAETKSAEPSNSKLQNLELENAELYPNPNTGLFNLAFDVTKKANTTILVTDAIGKEVYRENLKNFKGRYQKEIDLRHLSKGMYYLQINQGKHVYNKKLLLQ